MIYFFNSFFCSSEPSKPTSIDQTSSLSQLPYDLSVLILKQISAIDLIHIGMTSLHFKKFLKDENLLNIPLAINLFKQIDALPKKHLEGLPDDHLKHFFCIICGSENINLIPVNEFLNNPIHKGQLKDHYHFRISRHLEKKNNKVDWNHGIDGRRCISYKVEKVKLIEMGESLSLRQKASVLVGLEEINKYCAAKN